MERWRGERRFGAADRLAPVLPIVLYIGRARWTAAARVIDLVTPQAAGTGDGEAGGTWRAEGRIVGQRESLRRHAAMKFDAQTADRLAVLLDGVTDQEAFDSVLGALLECDTSSDMLARVTEARRRTNGGAGAG